MKFSVGDLVEFKDISLSFKKEMMIVLKIIPSRGVRKYLVFPIITQKEITVKEHLLERVV